MSRPFATRLVPTRTSSRPVGERVDDPLRGAAALDDVAVEAADPQVREALAGPRARPAPCRRRGSGSAARRSSGSASRAGVARPQWWQRSVVAGLVVDERPLAVRAGLDVAAVAAQDDRRGPAPVDDEDRLVAGRAVQRRERRRPAAPTAARGCRPRAPRAGRRPRSTGGAPVGRVGRTTRRYAPVAGPPDALDRRRRAAEDDRRAGQLAEADRGVAGLEPRRPVALVGGVVLLVDDRSGRRRASGARTASRVPTTMSTSPARIRRHSSARSPSASPEWTSATRASRSARSRSTSGIASAISGTRTRAGRPASSAAAIAST